MKLPAFVKALKVNYRDALIELLENYATDKVKKSFGHSYLHPKGWRYYSTTMLELAVKEINATDES